MDYTETRETLANMRREYRMELDLGHVEECAFLRSRMRRLCSNHGLTAPYYCPRCQDLVNTPGWCSSCKDYQADNHRTNHRLAMIEQDMEKQRVMLPARTVVSWTDEAGKKQTGEVIKLVGLDTYQLNVFQTLHGRTVRAGCANKRAQDLTVEVPVVTVAELHEHEDLGGAL